jgi:Family of unknown function (DUF6356)
MNEAQSRTLAGSKPLSHLEQAGEGYFQHMRCALSFAWRMICGGFCVVVHAFFPNVLCKKGSSCIAELHDDMVLHRKEFGEGRVLHFHE